MEPVPAFGCEAVRDFHFPDWNAIDFAAVDTYDALITGRVRKAARSKEEAEAERIWFYGIQWPEQRQHSRRVDPGQRAGYRRLRFQILGKHKTNSGNISSRPISMSRVNTTLDELESCE